MTTIAQVKKWTRPLMAADSRLTLIGRNLVLRPVRHLVRGVFVDQTSDPFRSRLLVYAKPLFAIPSEGTGFMWSRRESTFRLDEERFESDFLEICRRGFDDLSRIETIGDFLREADRTSGRLFESMPIHVYKLRHSVVLAALGRIDEARGILAPALTSEEAGYERTLDWARATLAKKPRDAVAKVQIEIAEANRRSTSELKPLLALLEAGDRAGVGTLLRRYEEHNARLRKVDHLWEPTPFPVEE